MKYLIVYVRGGRSTWGLSLFPQVLIMKLTIKETNTRASLPNVKEQEVWMVLLESEQWDRGARQELHPSTRPESERAA